MQQKRLIIINKLGLHARAAMKLVHLASRYQSEILMRYNHREVNAKSIMNVMILAASQGAEIEFSISGD
ncbi:MAG: phosphocarrier protein HPr, partial [Coxiella sp. RIFCSPHIGHO2_12_FULL_44_14]